MEVCTKENCTGCGACAYVCPKHCITMKDNEIGITYPIIDIQSCIKCNRCRKVCPQLEPPEFCTPRYAYAAWSSDKEERRTSASGGVAAELYKEGIEEGYLICGAISNEDLSVSHILTSQKSDIIAMKNSKYVFSTAYDVYQKLENTLKSKKQVIVIGLPCQIAAIKNVFPQYRKQLLLVDVVCHGTTPFSYLQQHITMLEKQCGKKATRMSFRDPDTYTYTYTFTLYDRDANRIYAQRTKDGDTYQFGYHRMVSYRENCYHCQYACEKRISDITLSDYKGLGKLAECSYSEQKVSSVLIHTSKGEEWIKKLISKQKIVAEERPVQEPIQGDAQLQHPSFKSKNRRVFEKYIQKYDGDFEMTMQVVMRRNLMRSKLGKILNIFRKVKGIMRIEVKK